MARDLKDLYLAVLDESNRLKDLQELAEIWLEEFDRYGNPGFPTRLHVLMDVYRTSTKDSIAKLQATIEAMLHFL